MKSNVSVFVALTIPKTTPARLGGNCAAAVETNDTAATLKVRLVIAGEPLELHEVGHERGALRFDVRTIGMDTVGAEDDGQRRWWVLGQ